MPVRARGLQVIRRLESALAGIERVVTSVAVVCLAAIMLIVVTDVFMRYAVNRPFSFTYDLVGLYLMAGLFYLSLSNTFAIHAHVSVDILVHRFSPPARRVCEIVTCLCGVTVFSLITWLGFNRTVENFVNGDVLAGAIPWPSWASAGLVPLGCGLLTLRLLLHLIAHGASLASGRDLIALPPLSGTGTAAQESNFE
jgi:TRAP-type C4-dicarboxylate transport system permease small subunit